METIKTVLQHINQANCILCINAIIARVWMTRTSWELLLLIINLRDTVC